MACRCKRDEHRRTGVRTTCGPRRAGRLWPARLRVRGSLETGGTLLQRNHRSAKVPLCGGKPDKTREGNAPLREAPREGLHRLVACSTFGRHHGDARALERRHPVTDGAEFVGGCGAPAQPLGRSAGARNTGE